MCYPHLHPRTLTFRPGQSAPFVRRRLGPQTLRCPCPGTCRLTLPGKPRGTPDKKWFCQLVTGTLAVLPITPTASTLT